MSQVTKKVLSTKITSKLIFKQALIPLSILLVVCALLFGVNWLARNGAWDEHFYISIHNNTEGSVTLTSPGTGSPSGQIIEPGMSISRDFSNASSLTYTVYDTTNKQQGCLVLAFNSVPPPNQRTVEVSSAQPCPAGESTPLR